MKKLGCVALCVLGCQTAIAGNVFMGYDIGAESFDIDQQYTLKNSTLERRETLFTHGINVGYQFDNGFAIEAGHRSSGSISLFGAFDHLSLSSTHGAVAYKFQSGKLSWSPSIMLAQTELKLTEGAFLHPGKEETQKVSDVAKGVGLELAYRLERFALSTKYRFSDAKYGQLNTLLLGISYHFKP